MLTKKLIAAALVSALGLSMSVAEARDFDHRAGGFTKVRHGDFRHGHKMRHQARHHHFHRGYR